ncbi:MAG: aldehyde dehydrogenase [Rhizobiales bacterium 32-66-11]|nr:MAG: aldehyde dehydrogenase [Rhizobiales bacterium 32-66-11]
MASDLLGGAGADALVSRRLFLKASSAAGGALLLGFDLLADVDRAVAAEQETFEPNAFVRVGRDGRVKIIVPYVEMGQGNYTTIPMLVAEELEVPLDAVDAEHAPPNEKLYGNPLLGGVQATGGSTATRAVWKPLREAGAAARTMLVAAAAQRWSVAPSSCKAQDGEVVHPGTGRRLTYGALVEAASAQPVPQSVELKRPEDFKLIGTSAKRLDAPAKVSGKAVYGIDVRLPNLKIATLAQSPVFGGRLKSVDDTKAKAVKGVRQIVRLDDCVAVVADHMGAAKKGLEALDIEWDDGSHRNLETADIQRELEEATLKRGAVAKEVGDVAKALETAARKVDATYQVPFLAHATMEPMNCTVHVRPDACEVWVGNQVIARAQAAAAAVTGLPLEKVAIHNHLIGGGFGRRLEVDGVTRAVQIAKLVDGPVKVIWTREEDIQHDMYRPFFLDRISAGLDGSGAVIAWRHHFAGSSILSRWLPPAFQNGLDPETIDGAANIIYGLPNFRLEYSRVEPPGIPTAFWRSVGPSHNIFVVESFIDELAAAAKKDPVSFRLSLLDHQPRAKTVLALAAEKSGWGTPLPERRGRGVSVQFVFGTYMAQVAEVEVTNDGSVRVRKVVCAVDCGTAINPDVVEAQVQGAVMFGISAALYGEISLKNGRVEQGNFDTYQVLRLNEAPTVEVHIVKNNEPPGGMGEPGTSAVVPAVSNAIYAATSIRLRRMPIDASALVNK